MRYPAHPRNFDGHPPQTYTPAHLVEKILASKSALEGECTRVTALFADLKGSMELLANRDLEDACQLLDPVLTLIMAAVHRSEGTTDPFLDHSIEERSDHLAVPAIRKSPAATAACVRTMRTVISWSGLLAMVRLGRT